MKICLVTGGAGFVGANLVHRLVKQGCVVHIFEQRGADLWRLSEVLSEIIVHEIDLIEFDKVSTLVKTVKPDTIFHLAASGVMPQQRDQILVYKVNFDGTINLLNACKEIGFECFINTGSSSEYGLKNIPMSEDLVLEPICDYGVSKAAATQYCLKHACFNDLPVYTIRLFSAYGDYEMPTRLIPHVLVRALTNQPLSLSSPNNVRDFIYIEDIVDAYLAIAEKKPKEHFIFNAGTGVQSSIKDVIVLLEKIRGKKLEVHWGKEPLRPWEPKTWLADVSRSKKVLGWQVKFSLEQGLEKSLKWFENHMNFY